MYQGIPVSGSLARDIAWHPGHGFLQKCRYTLPSEASSWNGRAKPARLLPCISMHMHVLHCRIAANLRKKAQLCDQPTGVPTATTDCCGSEGVHSQMQLQVVRIGKVGKLVSVCLPVNSGHRCLTKVLCEISRVSNMQCSASRQQASRGSVCKNCGPYSVGSAPLQHGSHSHEHCHSADRTRILLGS